MNKFNLNKGGFIMKKIILVLTLLLSALSFSAEKLYVGTNAEFKPYEYLEDGKMIGFDIELMEKIGEELGYEISWINMSFDGLLPALQLGKVDAVIAGLTQTPERQKAVDFSIPYMFIFSSKHIIIVNEKSDIKTKEELKDKNIGIQLGAIQEQFVNELEGKAKVYDSWTGALMDLKAGKIDSVIIDELSSKAYLENLTGIKQIDTLVDEQPAASIAFRKNEKELVEKVNKKIIELRDNGEYLKILEKYFPANVEEFKAAYEKK